MATGLSGMRKRVVFGDDDDVTSVLAAAAKVKAAEVDFTKHEAQSTKHKAQST